MEVDWREGKASGSEEGKATESELVRGYEEDETR
jgi:hypothetical protein